jgi:hypothetical protein
MTISNGIAKNNSYDAQIVMPVGYDPATDIQCYIGIEHYKVHTNSHFYFTFSEILNEDANSIFFLSTPDSERWAHMLFEVEGSTRTELYLYENASYSGGSLLSTFNNNRNSIETSSMVMKRGSTIVETGSLIFSQSRGFAGATPNVAPLLGLIERGQEIVLKQNTGYFFEIISRGNDNSVSTILEWYEHTSLN